MFQKCSVRNPKNFENYIELLSIALRNFDLFRTKLLQIAEISKKNMIFFEFFTRIEKNQRNFENKTAKMRKSLTTIG